MRVLGAESTGKSTLCAALGAQAMAQGLNCAVVDEYLRRWCLSGPEGLRLPQRDDQFHIARRQQRRIAVAGGGASADLVVADTCGLMTQVYSAHFFDHALPDLGPELAFDLTLVCDTDLPWQADPLRDGPAVREAVQRRLLGTLAQRGVAYTLLQGTPDQRVSQAWAAIQSSLVSR